MAVTGQRTVPIVLYLDSENDRKTTLKPYTIVYCKDTGKTYILVNKQWNLIGAFLYNWGNKDVQSVYIYYGFSSGNNWKIKRKTITTSIWGTASGVGSYAPAWADRNNKTYS